MSIYHDIFDRVEFYQTDFNSFEHAQAHVDAFLIKIAKFGAFL